MRAYSSIFLVILLIGMQPSFSQSEIEFGRYATAWASDSSQHIPPRLLKSTPRVMLMIPDTGANIKKPNGNRYIQLHLINLLPHDIIVNRSDATVSGVTTEILVDGRWKIFQARMTNMCGHGKWKMTLKSKHYMAIELEDNSDGSVETRFRVRMKTAKYEVVSNTILVSLREELIKTAGTLPPLADSL